MSRKLASALAALALAGGIAAAGASTAQAATPANGVCEAGEVCFYYNSNFAGSLRDYTASDGYYTLGSACDRFVSPGAGQGECIKNNVASVRNRSAKPLTVYYNSFWDGAAQTVAAGTAVNLNATLKNNNASHFLPPALSLDNPYGGVDGPNGGWTSRAAWLADQLKGRFGLRCSTYATGDATSEHINGNGLDCWGPLTTRRTMAEWAKNNAGTLEIYYVIHEQKIWSLPKAGLGWRPMADRGSITANHYDHVHISMQHPGYEY